MSADPAKPALSRRALARELSACANASVAQTLASWQPPALSLTRRVGITGSPGSGKSTLISLLLASRSRQRLGVLAIDPSSPASGGAILGDRVRMDAVIESGDVYIRSLASRRAHDGLADNLAALLNVMDRHAFDEVILETVGVGQTEYAVRLLVDTLVLVLAPSAGDAVQAMKSGLMEMPDLYVINKADMPGAAKTATETRAIVSLKAPDDRKWTPQVLEVSAQDPASVRRLSEVIDAHQAWLAGHRDVGATERARRRHQLSELIARRTGELADGVGERLLEDSLPALYAELARLLAEERPAT